MDRRQPVETAAEVERLREVYRGYSLRGLRHSKWSVANRGNQALVAERRRALRDVLATAGWVPLGSRRVLEVGCGTGEQLAAFKQLGAAPKNLFGIDLVPDRIRRARRDFPELTFQRANAETLPFAADTFDLVAAFTVFTSILSPAMAANVAREINRVLRSGGAVIWYDFRISNPCNRHVRGVSRQRIRRLFPGFTLTLKTVSLLPPLARRLGALTGALYPGLSRIPFLRTHYLGLLAKP
jgi:SAM-dependent methyltransferase